MSIKTVFSYVCAALCVGGLALIIVSAAVALGELWTENWNAALGCTGVAMILLGSIVWRFTDA